MLLNYYWGNIPLNCLSHLKCWVKANSAISLKLSKNICAWTVRFARHNSVKDPSPCPPKSFQNPTRFSSTDVYKGITTAAYVFIQTHVGSWLSVSVPHQKRVNFSTTGIEYLAWVNWTSLKWFGTEEIKWAKHCTKHALLGQITPVSGALLSEKRKMWIWTTAKFGRISQNMSWVL